MLPRAIFRSLYVTVFGVTVPKRQRMSANAGTRGFFGKGDMQKEFEEASFNLKPGEISHVVQTASGLHLIERYVPPSHFGACATFSENGSPCNHSHVNGQ